MPEKPTYEELAAELAEFKANKAQDLEDEQVVADKMSKGLRRPQAVSVIKRQREFDQSAAGKQRAQTHATRQAIAQHVTANNVSYAEAVKAVTSKSQS
jgi:hypothetical protein